MTSAITVLNSATVMLGQDRSGDQVGPVNVGQAGGGIKKGAYFNDGWIGINCQGCTLVDSSALAGATGLFIEGQIFADLLAGDGSTITLKSAPVIGAAPNATSFNTCFSKLDAIAGGGGGAVLLTGLVNMTFENGHVQCIAADAFQLFASSLGAPTLSIDSSTIQNTEAAIVAGAGSATVSSSTFQFNYNGVEQLTDGTNFGTIDLSGKGLGGTNTIVCSSDIESHPRNREAPRAPDVLNETSMPIVATNVAWDTAGARSLHLRQRAHDCACARAEPAPIPAAWMGWTPSMSRPERSPPPETRSRP